MPAKPLPTRSRPGTNPLLSNVSPSPAGMGLGVPAGDLTHSSSTLKNPENLGVKFKRQGSEKPSLKEREHFLYDIRERSELITCRSIKKDILGKITSSNFYGCNLRNECELP